MDLLNSAFRGAQARAGTGEAAKLESIVVLGAGGALGSSILERTLSCGQFAPVRAVVREQLPSSLRGLAPCYAPNPHALELPLTHTALMVFERERRSNRRDDAFVQPTRDALLPWARALAQAGVQRLMVVVPHAPSMLPAALKQGFANGDEQALAALGFTQLLILRPAQTGADASGPGHPVQASRLQRFANWWLAQLNWMVPPSEQAVRTVKLSELVVELARLLATAPAAMRVLPPDVLASAAVAPDSTEQLRQWLHTPPG